ncbi:hypothetical protein COY23_01725 [bacterium (Candidatus Torokbacteria) CG_4_10_14_0_2_um_filter_35_8]|nr:MAG: hypothetical protein COY23_01725 [bacterium (Candidatus Torokbacteria) CG_4_10_14_0_2_um_filter_35_8]
MIIISAGIVYRAFSIEKSIDPHLQTELVIKRDIIEVKTEDEAVEKTASEKEETPPKEQPLKKTVFLPAPYTCQAPFAQWDYLHENACEEAALLIVHYYLSGKKFKDNFIPRDLADKEIKEMVASQMKIFGRHKDLYEKDFVKFIKKYYGYKNIKVIHNTQTINIKKELSKGNPVIIPARAKLLQNPYYHHPGYHMLVAIGYDKSGKIITNDPGTKRGQNYKYDPKILKKAYDFEGGWTVVVEK